MRIRRKSNVYDSRYYYLLARKDSLKAWVLSWVLRMHAAITGWFLDVLGICKHM